MKTLELARLVLDQAPHHSIAADLDGWDCLIVDVDRNSARDGAEVVLVCELPEGYRLLPTEPSETMLAACEAFNMSDAVMGLMWATMVRAHDDENE